MLTESGGYMNIKEIMNITPGQLRKMDRAKLADTVSILASAANKRLKRAEQAGVKTAATESVQRSGGKFSVKGKDVTQLVQEAQRATRFLNAATGGLGKASVKQSRERAAIKSGDRLMSTRQLLQADIDDLRSMGIERLKRELDKAAKVANQRINRMLDSGMMSKAVTNVLTNEGLFTSEGKTTETELINEIKRAKQFLGNKTSLISGQKKVHAKLEQRLGGPISQKQEDRLWSVYNMLKETNMALIRSLGSETVQKMINSKMTGKKRIQGADALFKRVEKEMRQAYEEREGIKSSIRAAEDFSDVSDNVRGGNNF